MDKWLAQLAGELTEDDISEQYRPIVEIIGIKGFVALSDYAKGDELYFPKVESIIAPVRNRHIKAEWTGYNKSELAAKYNLTTAQLRNILKDEPTPGQMSIFDFCYDGGPGDSS